MMFNLTKKLLKWLILPVVIISGLVCGLSANAADIQKKLINYQGYLTDNSTPPIPLDGTYSITFRIYNNSGSQVPLWSEQHTSVNVVRGNVSVLLGSITDMDLAFDEPRYLGIQVSTEPEMTPRQRLLPSFQATSANRLNVTHANGNRSEFTINRIVAIGTISPYYGNPNCLPDSWKVCDGSTVNDPKSPFNGMILPDFRKR